MDEYVYAGKGWEPKVGDVCEAYSSFYWNGWIEVEITSNTDREIPGDPYVIVGPSLPPLPLGGRRWVGSKKELRKRITPDHETNDVTMDDLMANLKGVTA